MLGEGVWAGVPVAHSQLLFLEMHITLCVRVCITDMSKQTQSSVKYFLGYLPEGWAEMNGQAAAEMGMRNRGRGRGWQRVR